MSVKPNISTAKYSRVLIKISGEALMGPNGYGLHPPTVEKIAREKFMLVKPGEKVFKVIESKMMPE